MNNRETHYFDHKKFYSLFNLTGMTQGEFGKRVGVSGPAISQYINGHNAPCEKTINKMCVVLGCSYGDLKKSKSSDWKEEFKRLNPPIDNLCPRTNKIYKNNYDSVKALVAVANDDNAAVIMRAIKELMK